MIQRDLTLCLAFYRNGKMLATQLDSLADLPEAYKERINLVVVDDCSPKTAAKEVFESYHRKPELKLASIQCYRMKVDIPWNQDACRNLAVLKAPTEWVMLTDMDHVSAQFLPFLMISDEIREATVYQFGRVTAPEMTPYKPHGNSYFMTKTIYDQAGGYDERYAGIYGTDGAFVRAVTKVAPINRLTQALIRYPREVIADASTSTLPRKSKENDVLKRERQDEIIASGDLTPKRGLYEYELVFACA